MVCSTEKHRGAASEAEVEGPLFAEERASRAASTPPPDTLTPADRYQELFTAVQAAQVFADSKTFVDCAPRTDPNEILASYRRERDAPDFALRRFVQQHFEVVVPQATEYVSSPGQPLAAHIDALWDVLTRHPSLHPERASALQLPRPYVVPGGRFGELYYWDSYFIMLGLAASGRAELVGSMLDCFAYLIDTYGRVPNGTRTYYLSRSQPPLFAGMVTLAERAGVDRGTRHLPQLLREHAFWMRGEDETRPGRACRRVVRLADGSTLNRHWDDRDTPREEAWVEDVATAERSGRPVHEVYRHLRAATESGWDFSTRWLRAPVGKASSPEAERAATAASLATICTTDIVPVDLNALLFALEEKIASLALRDGQPGVAREYHARAQARREALLRFCWDAEDHAFVDYDFASGTPRLQLTAATVVPLFVGLAGADHARGVASAIEARLLDAGGLATTEHASDQQWDRPNGWAPLQWMAVRGLERYGHDALAKTIGDRWLATVAAVYEREGKLVEKYALRERAREGTLGGFGGEYPLQDGFGWTNGVTRALLVERAAHTAHRALAHAAHPIHR